MTVHFNSATGKLMFPWEFVGVSGKNYITNCGKIVPRSALTPQFVKGVDPLHRKAGGTPALDLDFTSNKSLAGTVSGKNLVTFSRASSGTYVGSDGLIKTTPVNLLTYSEEVDQWNQLFNATVTANAALAPDGSMTADRVRLPASSTTAALNSYVSTSGNHTGSIYVKAVTSGTDNTFNLYLGSPSELFTATDEWQRFTFTLNNSDFRFGIVNGDDSFVTDVLLWGAQLEEGTTATDYIPTGATIGGAPRFDHDPVTGESLGLLIEEERTNLIINSTTPTLGSVGANPPTITTSPNQTLPDGQIGSVKLIAFASSASRARLKVTGSFTGTFTGSYYWKLKNGGTWAREFGNAIVTGSILYIDVTCFSLGIPEGSEIYLTFGQIEQGSFPTSYIPTSGSAVTRSPDIATIEGNKFAKTNLLEYSERFDQTWATTGTIVPNATTAPDGTLTADKMFTDSNSPLSRLTQTPTVANGIYTFSFYAKAGDTTSGKCVMVERNPNGTSVNVTYNLTNGTIAVGNDGSGALTNQGIESVGNGWYRIFLTFDKDAGSDLECRLMDFASFSNKGGLFLWGAQLEAGSELTEYTPSVETFVSRASTATYVDDATGLIKTSPVNLLTYSEEFDQSGWVTTNSTVTTNVTSAPDGTATADRVTSTTSSDYSRFFQDVDGNYSDSIFTIYLRSDTPFTGSLRVRTNDGSGNVERVVKNIDVTTEWERFDAPVQAFTTSADVQVFLNEDGLSGTSLSGRTLDAWGAQLEAGTTATPYIKTTSTIGGAARYENGELLLEEARTNLLSYSQDFTNSFWRNALSSSTVSSPDGGQNAYELTNSNTLNQDTVESAPANTTNTSSIFAKYAGTGNAEGIQIRVGGIGSNAPWANFDLVNGSKGNTSAASGSSARNDTWTLIDYGIEPFANGWYRIHITYTCSDNSKIQFRPSDSPATDVESSTGSGKVLVFGAQVEVSSPDSLGALYTTSYIPTTTSAVTRAADVSTSALGVDSWYNQSEGTFFTHTGVRGVDNNTAGNSRAILYAGPNQNNAHWLEYRNTGTHISTRTRSGGSGYYSPADSLTPASYLNDKVSISYSATGGAGAIGGVVKTSSSLEFTPIPVSLEVGSKTSTKFLNGHISRLAYFPTRLSDDELKSITT